MTSPLDRLLQVVDRINDYWTDTSESRSGEVESQLLTALSKAYKSYKKRSSKEWQLMEQTFKTREAEWKKHTCYMSSELQMCSGKHYEALRSMGPVIIPLILESMQVEIGHWFPLLRELTGEDPVVPPEAIGKMQALTDIWLEWGRAKGLIDPV